MATRKRRKGVEPTRSPIRATGADLERLSELKEFAASPAYERLSKKQNAEFNRLERELGSRVQPATLSSFLSSGGKAASVTSRGYGTPKKKRVAKKKSARESIKRDFPKTKWQKKSTQRVRVNKKKKKIVVNRHSKGPVHIPQYSEIEIEKMRMQIHKSAATLYFDPELMQGEFDLAGFSDTIFQLAKEFVFESAWRGRGIYQIKLELSHGEVSVWLSAYRQIYNSAQELWKAVESHMLSVELDPRGRYISKNEATHFGQLEIEKILTGFDALSGEEFAKGKKVRNIRRRGKRVEKPARGRRNKRR